MIYLDNASTSYVDKRVLQEMNKYFSEIFGNPSSQHAMGIFAKDAVENSRRKIASILNCKPNEIIFTSGGTESVNLAIKGYVEANEGNHIITSKIEHEAVLKTCEYLEKKRYEVTYLDVDNNGLIDIEQLKNSIKENTALVSIMYANNEIGTIQNIQEIAKICKEKNVAFHTDACQAAGYCNLDCTNFDMMSLNSSKIYGPKGVGCLFVKEGIKLEPLIHGGGQENGLRSGTENMPAIVGFAKALEIAEFEKDAESRRLGILRDKLIKGLKDSITGVRVNGVNTLPNSLNISIDGVQGETLVKYLNQFGICTSVGSACTSNKIEPSHVLKAIGLSDEDAISSIRFTLGRQTNDEDIEQVLEILPQIVNTLRKEIMEVA